MTGFAVGDIIAPVKGSEFLGWQVVNTIDDTGGTVIRCRTLAEAEEWSQYVKTHEGIVVEVSE